MDKLLIADHSGIRASMLSDALRDQWDVTIASDGYMAVELLDHLQPDALIINLNLSWLDGISVLKQCFPKLPPIIIALSTYTSPYVEQDAVSLGVGFIFTMPFTIPAVANRLNDMRIAHREKPGYLARHIRVLGIAPHRDGYRYLIEAIQLLPAGNYMRLQKELYHTVAANCGAVSAQSVERAIRLVIQDAWKKRNRDVWEFYFPDTEDCPTNGEFIARLTEMI